MNNAARLAFVLVAASSVPAFAQYAEPPVEGPSTVQPAQPAPVVVVQPQQPVGTPMTVTVAPQNEDWNDVSHINGVPVKVGERGDYLHRFRKTNISSNPIGWLFGVYGLSVSHAIHNNVAIKFDGNIFSGFEGSSGYEVGASLPIYFKRVYSGPFIEPGIISRGLKHEDSYYYDSYGSESQMETSFGPAVMFGWHSTFDSGLNVAAAAGAMRNLNEQPADEYGYQEEPIEFAGYFRVGYAF